jgi:hypothetical protein
VDEEVIIHRFIVYVARDLGGYHKYEAAIRYCNRSGADLNVRLRFSGPITKTGLEGWINWIKITLNNDWSGSSKPLTNSFIIKNGECITGNVEYEIREGLMNELDLARRKLIMDGRLFIAGFEFDLIQEKK